MIRIVHIIPDLFGVLLGLAPIIPGGLVQIRLVHIILDLFRVLLGLAPVIPGGPVLIRLVLIIFDIYRVLLGLCTYHSWRSGHDTACTYHSRPLPGLVLAFHLSFLAVRS